MKLFQILLNIQVNSIPLAYKNEVYIERIDGIKKKIISLSRNDFQNEKLNDGDILMAKQYQQI